MAKRSKIEELVATMACSARMEPRAAFTIFFSHFLHGLSLKKVTPL
jgi:hypothetical protein